MDKVLEVNAVVRDTLYLLEVHRLAKKAYLSFLTRPSVFCNDHKEATDEKKPKRGTA